MVTVTIHDEATRAAAWKALWGAAGNSLDGETFSDLLFDTAWQLINVQFGSPRDADPGHLLNEQLERLDRVRSAAAALAAAEVGSSVELPAEAEDLACALADCVSYIQDPTSEFWEMGSADRDWAMACHDAGLRLLTEMQLAEAVA